MVKKAFALSLLFAISNANKISANECIQNIDNLQTECTNNCSEDTYKAIEDAKYLTMNIELKKTNDTDWTPLAECTYAMLTSLKDEDKKETTFKNMKSYVKQIYKMAHELNISGNMNLIGSEEAPIKTKTMPKIDLEDIINGNTISITCTIEKCDNNCNAIQDMINHVKAMAETENDFTPACIKGMLDLNGMISINVK